MAAVNNLTMDLRKNEVLGLIGPNGAGKTTVINLISGLLKPTSGNLYFEGKRIDGLSPNLICRLGIARTFQIPRPFKNLTVFQNLMVAAINGGGFSAAHAKKEVERVIDIIGLKGKENMSAGSLTLMELKRLELGRALSMKPKLLLADEVAAGSRENEIAELLSIFKMLKEMGLSILVVEHIMSFVMKIADRVVVMNSGEKLAEGKPEEVSRDIKVIEVYLGKREAQGVKDHFKHK
ncbi:MAG: ABC transporter ATP-binding protein [Candidatus Bathyarchaeia archaeon]